MNLGLFLLQIQNPSENTYLTERAEKLFKASEEAAKERYEHLLRLVELYK